MLTILAFDYFTPFSPPTLFMSFFIEHANSEREKKLVFLTARVHPGESPASFICQGKVGFAHFESYQAQTYIKLRAVSVDALLRKSPCS